MKPTPLIAGNWKMHKTIAESLVLVDALCSTVKPGIEVAIAPPFTALHAVGQRVKGTSLRLASQNVHFEASGAFTGEIAAEMLLEVGCTYAIIGHSERRQFFGETDATVNQRARAALAAGLVPIVCVGETLTEREAGKMPEVIERQVKVGLAGMTRADGTKLVLAYEPVWAIGTGKVATPAQAQEVHAAIRKLLGAQFGAETGAALRILYGGSVKADNARELLGQPDINGALVGGASLKAAEFGAIVAAA